MASDKGHIRRCILFPAEKEAAQGICCALGESAVTCDKYRYEKFREGGL
jgi:hypothetical protein